MTKLPIVPRVERILVVDDDLQSLKLLSRRLRALDYVVFEAESAERALEIGRLEDLDLVLSDVVMPVLDGIELTRHFKNDAKHLGIPVVLMTASRDPHLRILGLAAGADDFLQKPIDSVELELRIRGQLRIHQFQEDLRARVRLLEMINAQKDELLGTVAHDLRNPLGVVLTFSELLLGENLGTLGGSQRNVLTRVVSSAEFMLRMINNLLDLACIDSGNLHLQREQIDMVQLIRENVTIHSMTTEKSGTLVTCELPETLMACVDRLKFDQVLNNLIGNAVKFSPTGSTVVVKLVEVGGNFELSVMDSGPGIAVAEREFLFKPFSKLTTKPTNGAVGTGLGLAIVRRIVEAHEGSIRVESEPEKGSTFVVSVPRE